MASEIDPERPDAANPLRHGVAERQNGIHQHIGNRRQHGGFSFQ
jgi:hypothetical protein